jgi:pimeloyl-ACP methyl ester carboxylesterase
MRPYGEVGDLLARFDPAEARARFEASETAAELARLAPDNLASLRGFFDRPEPATFGALLSAIAADGPGVDEAAIRRLRVPTLVIGHGHDLAHPFAMAQRLALLIPGAQLAEITPKSLGRAAYVREFQDALAGFLRRVA